MATLVLSAVGGAIGGPVGAAIGAVIGQAIDRDVLFRPKDRVGPRLTELALQTSSYGTQIPRLYGTMRVAGTVIWSTDLIESRSTSRSGKGQPSMTTYSYSASFAVLLSARPILDVRRIWADGNLLRGAGGDFKTPCGFRLHPGGEEQAADPLIAAAEGGGLAPAHRGCGYVVFEQMPLADYGNRIPSLTFEVVADPGVVAVSGIAADLAPELSGDAALTLGGFAASGTSVAGVLETLGTASGAWFAASGAGIAMRDAAADPRIVADSGMAADARGTRRTRSVAALETVPRTITVAHYDPARDYQTSVQRARRPGAGQRDDRVEVPAVLSAGDAKAIAQAVLARAEAERLTRTITAGLAAMDIAPGDTVRIEDEPGTWRVTRTSLEAMVVKLTLVPLAPATSPAGAATSGRVAGAVDAAIGRTIIHAFETPALDDGLLAAPRLSIAAAGEGAGWRRAALLYSVDAGATWVEAGSTAAPAVMGTVASSAPSAPATIMDRAGAFEVTLAHGDMMLGDADAVALDRGGNLALIGDELVQFGRAVPMGANRWRLTQLLRGRRGTEAAAGTQASGDRFVLLEEDAVRTIDLPLTALRRTVRVMASGAGDVAGPVGTRVLIGGASVLPPAPVHPTLSFKAGDADIRWARRSRAGWRWIDNVDAPIGEEREAYRVTVTDATGAVRTIDTVAPGLTIAATDRTGALSLAVRQRGTCGESPPLTISIPAP